MLICGIYKITNLVNGKVYIGQSINIAERWKKHLYAKDDFAIHQALRKYGVDNFKFEVIEECSRSDLDEREQYWIDFYDAKKSGYNMIDGGSNGAGFAKGLPIMQYSLDGEFIATYPSASQAAGQLGLDHSSICACARGETSQSGGFQWKYEEDSEHIISPISPAKNIQRPVIQYTLEGVQVRKFSSLAEAAQVTNLTKPALSKACQGKTHTCGGYRWRYEGEPLVIKKAHEQPLKRKSIEQVDKNTGEVVATFDSITEASQKTGINCGNIGSVCTGARKTAGGFIWRYLKTDNE